MSGPPSPIRNQSDLTHLLALSPSQTDSHVAGLRGKIELIGCDLTDTERESERLTKKLNKRMSGGRADLQSPSEYFMDKLMRWHSNKKVERLKALLAQHLPKVKHLEEDVLSSVSSVSASKAATFKSANLVLALVDKQIDYYQQHMNFLEDIINDIRQCDYTIVREISEMKTAFAFSQELEGRAGANSRNSNVTSPNPFTVLLKIGVDSNGHVPSTRILDDDSVIPGFEYLAKPGGASSSHHEVESDCTILTRSLRREHLSPGVARCTTGEAFDPHAPEFIPGRDVHPHVPPQLTTVRPLPTTPRSLSPVNEVQGQNSSITQGHHDGTDYKRKCLQSHAINIQSLNLSKVDTDALFIQASIGSAGVDPKKKKMLEESEHRTAQSPRTFMRAVSDRLSGHFHKEPKETKEKDSKFIDLMKGRSWGSSPMNSDKHDKFFSDKDKEKAPSVERRRMSMGSFTPSLSYSSSTSRDSNEEKDASAGRFLRPLSLGHTLTTTPADTSSAYFTAISSAKGSTSSPSLQSSSLTATTPRSRSVSAGSGLPHKDAKDLRELNHHALLHAHNQNNTLSHISIDGSGIAYVDLDNNSPTSRHGHNSNHLEKHLVSTPDALSHDSSWSNFSHNSTANNSHNNLNNLSAHPDTTLDKQEKQRIKYAALLHHYPHLFHCLLDPAVKIIAKRLNKYLKFKDELQKSLIRAEAVHESETICLRKMGRVQKELQALIGAAGIVSAPTIGSSDIHSVGLSQPSTRPNSIDEKNSHQKKFHLRTQGGRTEATYSNNSSGSYSYATSSNCSSHDQHDVPQTVSMPVHSNNNHNDLHSDHDDSVYHGSDSDTPSVDHASATGGDTEGSLPVARIIEQTKLTDHEFCSTDDEHDVIKNEFSLQLPSRNVSPDKSQPTSVASSVVDPSDPTIIDSTLDAELEIISQQLLDTAKKMVEQLKLILAEEHDASEQLQRVRHLLSSATYIEEQIHANLSPAH